MSDVLAHVGETAVAAVAAALAELGVDDVEAGAVATPAEPGSAFDGFELPVQAVTVDDPAAGRTTFVFTQPGAARLAALTAPEGQTADIGAIGALLGTLGTAAADAVAAQAGEVAASVPPQTRLVAEPDPAEAWEPGTPVAVAALTICGEPAAVVVAVSPEALERVDTAGLEPGRPDGEGCGVEGAVAGDALRPVKVRLWAELGRTRMALGRAVGLAPGEVVELDAAVDDPVTIFVNGVRLGSGHLVVGDDGEWAFRVLEVSAAPAIRRELNGAAAPPNAPVEGKEA